VGRNKKHQFYNFKQYNSCFIDSWRDRSLCKVQYGSPFSYNSLPQADGSNPINTKLDALGFTNKETYFVAGQNHEFYGTTNGTWNNGTDGNSYLAIITNKITQFLWKQHKPIVDYNWAANSLSVTFSDTSYGSLAWWWNFGDGTFSYDPNPTHVYATAGSYNVKLYIENDIKSWDEITKSVAVTNLGINENSSNNFSVIPNPTNGEIQFNCNKSFTNIKYEIYDVLGKLIGKQKTIKTGETYSISSLTNGLYFLKISTENGNQTIKVLKQ
jgi:PKD repeat protein